MASAIISKGYHTPPIWDIGTKYTARVQIYGTPDYSTSIKIEGIPQLNTSNGLQLSGWTGNTKFLDIIINFVASHTYPYLLVSDGFDGFAVIDTYGVTNDPISVLYGYGFPVPPVPLPFSDFMFCFNVGKTADNRLHTCDIENNFPGPPFQTVFGYAADSSKLSQSLCYIKEFKGLRTPSLELSQVGSSWHLICITPSSSLIRDLFFQLRASSTAIALRRRI